VEADAPDRDQPIGTGELALVFGAALALRLVFLLELSGSPLFEVPLGDARYHALRAAEIAGGGWLGDEAFYASPLYPYFVASIFAVFGESPLAVRVAQAVLGSLACALVALAARDFQGSRRAGVLAGLVLAVYVPAIWQDGLLQKESLASLLTAAVLWLAARFGKSGARRGAAAAGGLLGLLILTRENAAALAPILAAWFLWARPGSLRRGSPAAALAFALACAAPLGLVALRNRAVAGDWLPTTDNAGFNFYVGNHRGADGLYAPFVRGRETPEDERADYVARASALAGRPLSPSEVSGFWFERALAEIRADPAAWLALLARKARLLLAREELMDAEALEAYRDRSRVLLLLWPWANFGVLLPLAALGAWASRARWRSVWVLHAASALLAAGIALFFVVGRFRLGLVPLLAPFAARGLLELPRLVRAPRLAPWLVTAAAALAANWPLALPDDPRATTSSNLAAAFLDARRPAEAALHARAALERQPSSASARFNLGLALAQLGSPAEAALHLREALRLEPDYAPDALDELGKLAAEAGDHAAAEALLREAVALAPGDPRLHYDLGLALRRAGRFAEARAAYRAALELDPGFVEARHNLAALDELEGDLPGARAGFEAALAADPDFLPSLLRLARLLATAPAAELRDGPRAVELALRARSLADPASAPEALDALAAAYAEAGRFGDALAALGEARRFAERNGRQELLPGIERRAELYRAGEPLRSASP
jgi:Flp pilus assembly protein TadD